MFGCRSMYSRGFTLIEVLVSMVILAIGLLGLAAMQAISLRDNLDAYYYQQATLLAYEMQDRIRGNSDGWKELDSDNQVVAKIPSTLGTGDACKLSSQCLLLDMAADDYGYWEKSVKKVLPAPKDTETKVVEISSSAQANTPCVKTYLTSLCLITRWGRVNTKDAGVLSKDSTFYLEVTP